MIAQATHSALRAVAAHYLFPIGIFTPIFA